MDDRFYGTAKIRNYRNRVAEVNQGMTQPGGTATATILLRGQAVTVTANSNTPYDALDVLLRSLDLARENLGIDLPAETETAKDSDFIKTLEFDRQILGAMTEKVESQYLEIANLQNGK